MTKDSVRENFEILVESETLDIIEVEVSRVIYDMVEADKRYFKRLNSYKLVVSDDLAGDGVSLKTEKPRWLSGHLHLSDEEEG